METIEEQKKHLRYPFTYCADYIRTLAGYDEGGTKISRSDASNIRQTFCQILGLDDVETAKKIADYYLENQDKIAQKAADELLRAIR
jgi:hypothetical protein